MTSYDSIDYLSKPNVALTGSEAARLSLSGAAHGYDLIILLLTHKILTIPPKTQVLENEYMEKLA